MTGTLSSVAGPTAAAPRPSGRRGRRTPAPGKPHGSRPCHHVPAAEVARLLGVDVEAGLPGDEAARRLAEFGPNRVTARRGTPAWLKFLGQFHQPLVYVLLLAAGV